MKNLGWGSLIFVYASFALVCFANVSSTSLSFDQAVVTADHELHTGHQISPYLHCQLTPDGCVSDALAVVLSHAQMYDSITTVELVFFGLILSIVVVLCFYFRGLSCQCVVYTKGIWYSYKPKELRFSSRLDFLAWTAFHTRSPNYFSVLV